MSKGFSRQETVQHSIDFSQNANKLNSLSNGTVNIATKNPAEILAKLQHQAKQDLATFYMKSPFINLPNNHLAKFL